jgi:hypothetical protein
MRETESHLAAETLARNHEAHPDIIWILSLLFQQEQPALEGWEALQELLTPVIQLGS